MKGNFFISLYRALMCAGLIAICNPIKAQQNIVMNNYNGEHVIQAGQSIIFTDGFHVPVGSSLRAFISYTPTNICRPNWTNSLGKRNYVKSYVARVSGIKNIQQLFDKTSCEANLTINFFDGLGRSLQNINVASSPSALDVVEVFNYDANGRQAIKYLPYVDLEVRNGNYKDDALDNNAGVMNFYNPVGSVGNQQVNGIVRTTKPFSKTIYESSPLNRIVEQGSAGVNWQIETGHTSKIKYGFNDANDVLIWKITATGCISSNYYAQDELFKKTLLDENWVSGKAGTNEEFKDKQGRTILKKIWKDELVALSTYYVYDDFGNLRYVLPPAVNENAQNINSFDETQTVFDQFIYGYHYDGKKRLIEKKIPGKGWEEMIYNPLDQVVFTRDAVQGKRFERAFTKYDAFGRIVMSGIEIGHTGSRVDVQQMINTLSPLWERRDNGAGNFHGYTNVSVPSYTPNLQPDLVNYYDDYNIAGLPYNHAANFSNKTKGLLTASKVKVLGSTDDFLWTVNYYDEEGRVVKTFSQHYLEGNINAGNYDEILNSYNFAGELTATNRKHYVNGAEGLYTANRFVYDHQDRLVETYQRTAANEAAANNEVLLSRNIYNELGQLQQKQLHNNIQRTNYVYNERGWLKSSTSNEFSMELKYNDALNGVSPQYNGNIANQVYNNAGTINTFNYSYDKLNRLTRGEVSPTVLSEVITYDVMGNINTLNRDGVNPNLYHYNGNRLWYAEYFTNGYEYDLNGNATVDGRNGMRLTYNYLNLPQTANKTGMSLAYTYTAGGEKLSKNVNGVIRHYIKGIEYNGNNIELVHTREGIARRSGTDYIYEYNLSDHLGNVRYSFNQNGTKLQSDDYYAFGKRKQPAFLSSNDNKYLYNGKELQEELLGQYDYGARFYDPVIGRWNVVDPASELDRMTTPYAYAFDDPIRHTDPDGMFGEDVNDDFDQAGPGPGETAAAVGTGAASIGRTIWQGLTSLAEGVEVVGTGVATAVAGTVALVFTPVPNNGGMNGWKPSPNGLLMPAGAITLKQAVEYTNKVKGDFQERTNNRDGKGFTPKGKETVIKDNKAKNGGKTICEDCGVKTTKPEQSKKGKSPPRTDTQVDHKKPKSKGGSGSPENGQVLCRDCNIKKGDKYPYQPQKQP